MRRLCVIALLLVLGLLGTASAGTFKLVTGETIFGEVLTSSPNLDTGVQIKVDEGKYERIGWARFSQEDLKNFAKIQKLQPFVEPFIESPPVEHTGKSEVPPRKQPPRLQQPAPQSLLGALFSSGVGVFTLLALYAANIYAGYEVAIYRGRPPLLVAGTAAIPFLGFLSPIVFLSLTGTRAWSQRAAEEAPPEAASQAAAAGATDALNPMQSDEVAHPAGLRLAHTDTEPAEKAAVPQTVTYKRGQFTFNRRFFETKFVGFFGAVRRDAERDMVLVIKSARGEYSGQRISRIAANDLHLEVHHGGAAEEIMIPFQEIQEVSLKHKDA